MVLGTALALHITSHHHERRIFPGLCRAWLATGRAVAVAGDVVGDVVGWLELRLAVRRSATVCDVVLGLTAESRTATQLKIIARLQWLAVLLSFLGSNREDLFAGKRRKQIFRRMFSRRIFLRFGKSDPVQTPSPRRQRGRRLESRFARPQFKPVTRKRDPGFGRWDPALRCCRRHSHEPT